MSRPRSEWIAGREKKVEVQEEEWARTALYVTICQDTKLLV